MSSASWARVKDLLYEAASLDPESRARFLDEVCATDASLRADLNPCYRWRRHELRVPALAVDRWLCTRLSIRRTQRRLRPVSCSRTDFC